MSDAADAVVSQAERAATAAEVVAWYRANRRDLPWRRTGDPYAIWISEIMCQQTRVATAIPYWERWLARFPTVAALADAPLDDVVAAWAGLGYYTRARNLHRGAREVVDRMDGALPRTAEGLRAVPGIGRYTAGAIASIAHGEATPVVDGNVARVLARLYALPDDVKSTAGQKRLWRLAGELVPRGAPGDFNQGLMELGATVCTPRSPRCEACPLRARCAARASGRQAELPVTPPRTPVAALPRLTMAVAWIERRGRVLLARRPPRGLYGGLWELPQAADLAGLEAAFAGRLRLADRRPAVVHDQVLSHRRLELAVWPAALDGRAPRISGNDRVAWHPVDGLDELGLSSATRAVIARLRKDPPCPPLPRPARPTRSASSRPATTRSSRA